MQRWRGVALVAAGIGATLWLAVGNQLVLYIHPRYVVFTVIMAALACVLVAAAVLRRRTRSADHDEPAPEAAHAEPAHADYELAAPRRNGRSTIASVVALSLATALALAMVVLPPATLTSATANQRQINSTTVDANAQNAQAVAASPHADFASFTVGDWSSLLRQTSDLAFYRGKPVDVTGFITADQQDPQNLFYVSRFVITCCAVDAQPVGVPVYLQGWASRFAADNWVRVTGAFAADPSSSSSHPIALIPTATTAIAQPSDPYLY